MSRRRLSRRRALALVLGAPAIAVAGVAVAQNRGISADARARALLVQRPFAPTNVDLFAPAWYAAAQPMEPAPEPPGGVLSDEDVAGMLQGILTKRFPDEPRRVTAGMRGFADESLQRKLPDARLRAALLCLTGTLAEPAIEFIRSDDTVHRVYFERLPRSSEREYFGWSDGGAYQGRVLLNINRRYEHEALPLLAVVLAHEALHLDRTDDAREELIAKALDTLVYMQLLLDDPAIATCRTELCQWLNVDALARLNCGLGDQLGLFDANDPILPGATTELWSFADFFGCAPPHGQWPDPYETCLEEPPPGNPVLRAYLERLTGGRGPLPEAPRFDDETLTIIDERQAVLSPTRLMRIARHLALDVPA